jgi:hypothetical protein
MNEGVDPRVAEALKWLLRAFFFSVIMAAGGMIALSLSTLWGIVPEKCWATLGGFFILALGITSRIK